MGREAFIDHDFRPPTKAIIDQANAIIVSYQAQGFTLTLRQLYYQFVARDLIPNRQTEYKRLGSIVNDARLAGLIDWSAIEDRTRNVRGGDWGYEDPSDAISSLASGYSEEFWTAQPRHVEVWIEKDALIGVIEPVCRRWRLPYLGCRGYVSQSEQYAAGKRFARMDRVGRSPVVLYLGDHDPSGMDMTRDHVDRLAMFARWPVEVRRLALNMSQIEEYDPPTVLALLDRLSTAERDAEKWHDAAMKAGVVVRADGSLIYASRERADAAVARVAELEDLLETFACLANEESDDADDECVVRLLYDHPDPEFGGPDTLLGELFMRPFRQARSLLTTKEEEHGN